MHTKVQCPTIWRVVSTFLLYCAYSITHLAPNLVLDGLACNAFNVSIWETTCIMYQYGKPPVFAIIWCVKCVPNMTPLETLKLGHCSNVLRANAHVLTDEDMLCTQHECLVTEKYHNHVVCKMCSLFGNKVGLILLMSNRNSTHPISNKGWV